MRRLIVATALSLMLSTGPASAGKLIDNLTAAFPYKDLGQSMTVRDLLAMALVDHKESSQLINSYMTGQLYGRDYHRRCDKVASKRKIAVFKRVADMSPQMTLTRAIAEADLCTVNPKRKKSEVGMKALDASAGAIIALMKSMNPNSGKDRHTLALIRNYMIGVLDGSYEIRGCTGPRKKMFADMVAITIAAPVLVPKIRKLNFNELMGIAIAAKCKGAS